jgi:hypothetical protein
MGLDRPGYVYVVQNPAWEGWVKVGLVRWRKESRSAPGETDPVMSSRISNLNISDPFKAFETVCRVYASCATTAERYAHELIEIHYERGSGEWFRCPTGVARRLVEEACSVARLRPDDRGRHWIRLLAEERSRMSESDTQKILQSIADVGDKARPPAGGETARAAGAVIRDLLEMMAMPCEHTEAAAKAVLRRLDALEDK